ncbi:MAG: efflux RND transporter periplasmic adaptor subunit [Thermodesulfovibrionales bacterium]|nr:efflux RND transporter periplasmic adaptor subunit [Thermodesulfovibrionales bacterium]
MKMDNKALKVILPVAILLAGFLVMMIMVKSRPEQKKVQRQAPAMLVEIMRAESTDTISMVHATATVSAAREVTLVPQVSGVVTSLSRNFKAGGFFKKGQLLFSIDKTDYALALKSAEAARAKALHTLETVRSRADIAGREWEILDNGKGKKPNPLVLYEPQLKEAQAALESADASVKLAELKLSRTKLRAPFDARVRSENIDVGQYIGMGSQVALLAGTETAEVVVPLLKEELGWISIPRPGSKDGGSLATVSMGQGGGGTAFWNGNVVRSLGEVDPKSRMVSVVVEIKDPYGIKAKSSDTKILLNGSFVDVTIMGRSLKDVFVLPHSVLREDSTIWVMDEQGLLRINKVNVLRTEKDRIIIDSGLKDGDNIVLTRFSGAARGLRLRTGAATGADK